MSSIAAAVWLLTFSIPALPPAVVQNIEGMATDYLVLQASSRFATKDDCWSAGLLLRDVLADTYKQTPIISCEKAQQ